MRILATADIHIGRRPGGIREADAERFSCANVWLELVRTAIEEQVSAVLVAGDMVDQANQFFEALAPLEQGLAQLDEHGITLYAVSGNHDCEVLAQLADAHVAGNFRLLGRGGKWEQVLLPDADKPEVQLFGWSFPRQYVSGSPLVSFPAGDVRAELAAIGLLHADRDASASQYGPVPSRELHAFGSMHWILGHRHAPDELEPVPRTLYPGSPQGMDLGVGECGPHGPVLIDMAPGRFTPTRLPTAAVRYERPELDLGVLDAQEQTVPAFLQAARAWIDDLVREQPGLQIVCMRPRCRCTSRLHLRQISGPLRDALQQSRGTMLTEPIQVMVDDVEIDVRPQVKLSELRADTGVLGQLARLILSLDAKGSGKEHGDGLLGQIGRQRELVWHAPVFHGLPDIEMGAADNSGSREALRRQAWRLLHELLLQRGGDVGV